MDGAPLTTLDPLAGIIDTVRLASMIAGLVETGVGRFADLIGIDRVGTSIYSTGVSTRPL